MKKIVAAGVIVLLAAVTPAPAHRLDEYLQATLISLERDRVRLEVRLTPGVAVFPIVFARIDRNADGVISEAEQRTYAEGVIRDLSLTSDGEPLWLRLTAVRFPAIAAMKEGLGEIRLEFDASLRPSAPNRSLTFENHHMSAISAYLANCLVPRDPDIRIVEQTRNPSQSIYQINYAMTSVRPDPGAWGWLGAIALVLFVRLALLWRQRQRRVPLIN